MINRLTAAAKEPQIYVNDIVDEVLIQGVLIDDMSLFHGKIGIAIALYHFSRSHNDHFSCVYADEIINQLYDRKNLDLDISLEKGLAGIAWGVCYLIENNFLEVDSPQDILEDIDKVFLKYSYKRFEDKSLATGLEGIYAYVLARQKLATRHEEPTVFCQAFVTELEEARQPEIGNSSIRGELFSIESCYGDFNYNENLFGGKRIPYGLYNGYSSVILKSCLK